ncbi:hypothetical protein QU39_00300 [Staphylococcus aureus]|jgi:hypothetical protein|nr:hypothetical protein QU39_00300 [Staphylococcus aureus]
MGFSNRCRDGVGFRSSDWKRAPEQIGSIIFHQVDRFDGKLPTKAEIIIHTKILRCTALPSFVLAFGQSSVVVGGVDSQA